MNSGPKQERPLISVIIPTYRRPRRLQACLDALTRQTVPSHRFEILVVDNGSDPPAAPRLPANARLLRCEDPGSYAARNRALEEAHGEYIAFTDDDCLPTPDWLEKGLEVAGPRRIVAGEIVLFFAGPKPSWSERYDHATGFHIAEFVREKKMGVTANLIVGRAAFQDVGPFDVTKFSGGDGDWCRRAVAAGYALIYAADARVEHPARTWDDLRIKTRRISGASVLRQPRSRWWQHFAWVFLGFISPRIRLTFRILRKTRFRLHHALGVWALTWAIRWIRLHETVRVMRGGTPLR